MDHQSPLFWSYLYFQISLLSGLGHLIKANCGYHSVLFLFLLIYHKLIKRSFQIQFVLQLTASCSNNSPLLLATELQHKGKLGLSDCVKASLMAAIGEEEKKKPSSFTFLAQSPTPLLFWDVKSELFLLKICLDSLAPSGRKTCDIPAETIENLSSANTLPALNVTWFFFTCFLTQSL